MLTWPEYAWRFAGRVPRTAFRPAPRVAAALRATRLTAGTLAGEVWPEQWVTLFRLLR
ncbi:hypothetical protein GA0070624_6575 [Micromonospora rhizosphaerae]|uniref:Uncharacterized protein n=1 Tax=Micromonospora rhizosphaerae TaxID=568872 RepID=A0A1C6TCH6_9ACTN|nr:hypothetical protein GA0070624_6575 [Micromonospora rhizosphaerae]